MRHLVLIAGGLLVASCSADPELASSPDADRIFQANCNVPPATSGGSSFQELYEQLFAKTGVATCQDSTCHGGSMGQGGFSMGADRKSAYDGLVAFAQVIPGAPSTDETPASVKSLIFTVKARKPVMPKPLCGNRVLNDAEIERIKVWGRAGAPNDDKK